MCLSFVFIKIYFDIYCQKQVYINYYVYWILFIHAILQMCFKYLVFVSIQVLEKSNFHFKFLYLKNIVFGLNFNSYTLKMVHMFVVCVDFLAYIFGLQFIYMNLFLWNLFGFN